MESEARKRRHLHSVIGGSCKLEQLKLLRFLLNKKQIQDTIHNKKCLSLTLDPLTSVKGSGPSGHSPQVDPSGHMLILAATSFATHGPYARVLLVIKVSGGG